MVINFERYHIVGCDTMTHQCMQSLYGITIPQNFVLDRQDGEVREIVLTNKRDKRFCQAMENDVELTYSMKDKAGDN